MLSIPHFVKDASMLRAAAPSLVFVGVEWCRYCQQAKPIMNDVASALGTPVPVYFVDADKHKTLAASLGVKSFPTIFFVTDAGIYTFTGERTVNNLVGFVCEHSNGSTAHSFCTAKKI
jgi:thioredoxin-like negative regulator of GroEL